jgi:hypothetical protein
MTTWHGLRWSPAARAASGPAIAKALKAAGYKVVASYQGNDVRNAMRSWSWWW